MDFINDALVGLKLCKFSTSGWLDVIENTLAKPEDYKLLGEWSVKLQC